MTDSLMTRLYLRVILEEELQEAAAADELAARFEAEAGPDAPEAIGLRLEACAHNIRACVHRIHLARLTRRARRAASDGGHAA